MTHTPGPYTIEVDDDAHPFGYIRLWAMDGKVHIGYINKQPGQMDRILADAALWRAAPLLLEACKEGRDMLGAIASGDPTQEILWTDLDAVLDKMNAAIATAEAHDA